MNLHERMRGAIPAVLDLWSPPPQVEDPVQQNVAMLMHHLAILFPISAAAFFVLGLLVPPAFPRSILIAVYLLVVDIPIVWMNRFGRARIAAFVLMCSGLAVNAVIAWMEGGMHAPEYVGFAILIVLSGMLLGSRWGFVAAMTSISCSALLVFLENDIELSAPWRSHTLLSLFFSVALTYVLVWIVQHVSGKAVAGAWQRAAEERIERTKAEEQLRLKESLILTVLNTSKDHILSYDTNLKVTAVNRPLQEMMRSAMGKEVVPGVSVLDWIEPSRHAQMQEVYRRALQGESLAQVNEWHDRYGILHCFVESLYPITDAQGGVEGVTVHIRDMTEWIRMDRALRESEERLRTVISNVPAILFAIDKEGIFRLSEGKGLAALGLRPGQVVGKSIFDVYKDNPLIQESVRSALHGKSIMKAMQVGDTFFDVYYAPLIGPDGMTSGVIGVATDITEQRRTMDRLREQASLLDRAHDAIFVKDVDGKITYWNREAEKLYGWSAEEAIGNDELSLLNSPEQQRIVEVARTATLSAGEWSGELLQRTRAGLEILVDSRWTLITDDGGHPRSILSINIDITEKKSLERQLIRSQRLEGLGTLAGGIAHDLNNILTPIMMSIEGLRTRHSDPKSLKTLETMEAGAQRGADIIKQLLTFARGMKGDFVNLQPRHILKDIERILRSTFPKSIEFRLMIDADLWMIPADTTQIHQVLLNLCVNARDAMPNGGILSLSAVNQVLASDDVRMSRDAHPGCYVVFSVADSGCGIPAGITDKIFDPFFTTKEVGKGTGLGLSTVLTIVKNHGGFITVYSELDRGSTFKVHLPAAATEGTDAAIVPGEKVERGANELILIVDDEEFVRDVAAETLEMAGYRVLVAANGDEGLKVFRAHREEISVVVTDILMPFLDGPALVRKLRGLKPNVPIVAMSGMIASDKLGEMKELGIMQILNKPFTGNELLRQVALAAHAKPSSS